MTIKCTIHNRGPGSEQFQDDDGEIVTVVGGQTVDVNLSEGMFKSLKKPFDDPNYRLSLVSAEVGETKPKKDDDTGKTAADLVSSTKTVDDPNAGTGENTGGKTADTPPPGDSIDKLLAEADAKAITFAQLRSRAKALLGNDFPLGTSPKMDEIVDLLRAAQKKQKAAG